jgi:hypothetical protein
MVRSKTQKELSHYAEELVKSPFASSEVRARVLETNPQAAASEADFKREFDCARLALLSYAWEDVCDQNGLSDAAVRKSLLRAAMNLYEASALPLATAFSDYYCSQDTVQEPHISVAIARKFVSRVFKQLSDDEKSAAVLHLVPVFESIRMAFENHFFEFVYD